MNSSETSPKLPMWVFFVADAVFVGAALLIARRSGDPLPPLALWAIVACVFAGALVGLVPLLMRFERQKNEMLDDRQRALEALARTVSASAEQISIAAGGLHGIAELAQKNLRHAEQLPHKLQDKIAEFQSQLAHVSDGEKEELEKELAALRSSETERLETVSDKIAKAVAELAKLETATRQHLTSANESVAKLALGTANAIGKAQAAAEQALAQARIEAARSVGEAAGQGARAIENARTAALADLDAHLTRHFATFEAKIAQFTAAMPPGRAIAPAAPNSVVESPSQPVPKPEPSASSIGEEIRDETSPHSGLTPPPVRRARKPRRDEPASPSTGDAAASTASTSSPPLPESPRSVPPGLASDAALSESRATPEPLPVTSDTISEIAPVVPPTAPPFASPPTAPNAHAPAHDAPGPEPATNDPARRRTPRKPAETNAEPTLDLEIDDAPPPQVGAIESTSLTSDGATRLLVTAYIGIGNRLYIRGDGPGLSWEKGVPLQFISIGKWRWETNEANGPVRFKLFKNDEVECTALGAQALDPGQQQEVTAAF